MRLYPSFALVLMLSSLSGGCKHPIGRLGDDGPGNSGTAIVISSEKGLEAVSDLSGEVKTHAETIIRESARIKQRDSGGHVADQTRKIDENALQAAAKADRIREISAELTELNVKYKETARECIEISRENDELKKKIETALHGKLMAIIIGGTLLAGVSLALCFYWNPKAIGGVFLGGGLIVTALIVDQLVKYAAVLGILGAVAIVGVIIYQFRKYKEQEKAVRVKDKALEETVGTVELVKSRLSTDARDNLFGQGVERGRAGALQSPETQEEVLRIRQKMRPKWGSTGLV